MYALLFLGALLQAETDFDFLLGSWNVKNRVLTKEKRWVEFASTSVNRPIWDGSANVEEWDGTSPTRRIQGFALRIYDPAAKRWSIYWADRSFGTLGAPISGTFKDGRGEFHAEGPTGKERVIWTSLTKNTCRWEQALSTDGGKTWETNWVMDFTRQGAK